MLQHYVILNILTLFLLFVFKRFRLLSNYIFFSFVLVSLYYFLVAHENLITEVLVLNVQSYSRNFAFSWGVNQKNDFLFLHLLMFLPVLFIRKTGYFDSYVSRDTSWALIFLLISIFCVTSLTSSSLLICFVGLSFLFFRKELSVDKSHVQHSYYNMKFFGTFLIVSPLLVLPAGKDVYFDIAGEPLSITLILINLIGSIFLLIEKKDKSVNMIKSGLSFEYVLFPVISFVSYKVIKAYPVLKLEELISISLLVFAVYSFLLKKSSVLRLSYLRIVYLHATLIIITINESFVPVFITLFTLSLVASKSLAYRKNSLDLAMLVHTAVASFFFYFIIDNEKNSSYLTWLVYVLFIIINLWSYFSKKNFKKEFNKARYEIVLALWAFICILRTL